MSTSITPRSRDFARWYTDVVLHAELADYTPVRGCMVIRPYGYALWENIQKILDERIKKSGHQNAYFPLLIPYSFIEKETQHIQGFMPHLAVVTHGGGEELAQPLVIRPTSETIIGHLFAKWIKSYRDLPLLINQWCNVVRWEMRPRLFLRTTEFIWQEGHTAHATLEEAEEEAQRMLSMYADFAYNELAIPVIRGYKSESEKFPGAVVSYTIEGMMGDGRALQMGTSHNFGQNFSRALKIQYLDSNDQLQYCWTTSWGVSTRIIGAIIMSHGDDRGLILPPRIAPIQAIIVPIYKNDDEKRQVIGAVEAIKGLLGSHVRWQVDDREGYTPGWKFNEWELRGVPIRIEVGPKDVSCGQVVLARRDLSPKEKYPVSQVGLANEVSKLLETIQANLLQRSLRFREEHTRIPGSYAEFKEAVEDGFALAHWCESTECENAIQEETKATNRCIPLESKNSHAYPKGKCIRCGKPANERAVFAKTY